MLHIYNTLTRKKEEFQTIEPGRVKMYVCGPTVYDNAHVGHAMSAIVFDVIRRYLEYRGYQVKHVMNFTDVDDKIIHRANAIGADPFQLAEGYIQAFRRHTEDLNMLPTINPRATQSMDKIQAMIQGLIERGYAYAAGGDVYFRVTKDEDYGQLSGRKLDDMQAGARIEIGEHKQHPMDFALWKAAKPGEPAWDSPWGKGRPGWHIECSAMNLNILGEQIDIHGGGNDLIFPHHENEIAQSESYTGKSFARYWLHNGMMQFSGEKMSKSLGNLVTIQEFLSKHDGDVLRLMVSNGSYRAPLTFNDEVIEQAERGLDRLRAALKPAFPGAKGAPKETFMLLQQQIEATRKSFVEAMDDDFNTAGALGIVFDFVRVVNQARDAGATDAELKSGLDVIRELTGVLGLRLAEKAGKSAVDPFVELLVEVRLELRKQKLWALSDVIRDKLISLGVTMEDAKDGTSWRWS
jgi:cysteinyl-tRNA synthetase